MWLVNGERRYSCIVFRKYGCQKTGSGKSCGTGFLSYARRNVISLFATSGVKFRVTCVEVLAVQLILNKPESLAKALEMHYFPGS